MPERFLYGCRNYPADGINSKTSGQIIKQMRRAFQESWLQGSILKNKACFFRNDLNQLWHSSISKKAKRAELYITKAGGLSAVINFLTWVIVIQNNGPILYYLVQN